MKRFRKFAILPVAALFLGLFAMATALYANNNDENYYCYRDEDVFSLTLLDVAADHSAGGHHKEGTLIFINAGARPGHVFSGWTVVSGGVTLSNPLHSGTSFVMPANNVVLQANWLSEDIWHVDVRQSWSDNPGGGNFRAGDAVTINAGHRHNFAFAGWAFSHNLPHANPFNPSTTFTMPHHNVQVTAIWIHIDDWAGWDWPGGTWPDWWWNQWPDGHIPDWWWNQWPGGHIPDWWWSGWQPPNWQLPNWQRPGAGPNWQLQQRSGVTFSYAAGNFPETLAVNQGSTINFQLRVQRHLASFSANFVGQWLRNGSAHGSTFPITLSTAGFADVSLSIPSLASATAGSYSLRVATIVNGVTTHVDISRVAALSIAGQGQATIWPLQPELPALADVNPMPTPRPNLHTQPATPSTAGGTAALTAAPSHNHSLVLNSTYPESAVLQILPGTNEVRLYGMTLDAMIEGNTTLFVVNDLVWTVMPPDFLAHLRERGGSFIGPNGGTFNIGIGETHGGATLVTARINLTTTLNGTTRPLTDFAVPYALAIELWDFGMADANPNHIAVFHAGSRLPGYVSPETGVLSLNVMTTGDFDVNYVID
jgi:hypothetical protein